MIPCRQRERKLSAIEKYLLKTAQAEGRYIVFQRRDDPAAGDRSPCDALVQLGYMHCVEVHSPDPGLTMRVYSTVARPWEPLQKEKAVVVHFRRRYRTPEIRHTSAGSILFRYANMIVDLVREACTTNQPERKRRRQ